MIMVGNILYSEEDLCALVERHVSDVVLCEMPDHKVKSVLIVEHDGKVEAHVEIEKKGEDHF